MAVNFINNDEAQSTSLAVIDYRPGSFDAKGVFQLDDASYAFWCQVCNKPIMYLQMVPMHIVGKRHCLKLDEARASCDEKVDGHFACKLCTNFVAPNWRAYLHHFEEKQHFQELSNAKQAVFDENSQNSNVLFSYNTLIMNQVIEHESETYFCCCCKQLVIGQNLILQHISEKCHKELQRTSHKNKDAGPYREDESARFVRNFIFHVDFSLFNCNLCDCLISGKKNCWQHIRGTEHIRNLIIREDPNYESLTRFPSPKLPQDEISESLAKLMQDNSITGTSRTNEYHCKLCGCMLADQKNIVEHLSGKRHKKSMESGGNVLQVSGKSVTKIEETSTGSSSSWESTDNSSRSWETYEDESQSSGSYENSSYSCEFSNNFTDSWETISIQGSSSDSQRSKSFKISSNLMPLISKHGLHHLEKEIFCSLCNAHLKSEQCLINHTKSKYHIAELNRHKDQIANKNMKQSTSSQNNNAANPPTTAIKDASHRAKNYELGSEKLNDEAKKVESRYSTLFEKCANLIPLISEHMLQYGKQEFFCSVCQARLQSPQSLLEHTKSQNHVMRLNIHKARMAKESKESTDASERNSSSGSFSNTICKHKSPNSINTKNEFSTLTQKTLTKKPQSLQSRLFRLPNYLMWMLAPHFMQHLKKSVFCQACQLHMKHVNTVREHMTGKKHAARLSSYKAKIANKGGSSQSTNIPRSNSAINSPMNVVMKNRPNIKSQNNGAIPKAVTSNPQNSQSILMDIPKKLLPLITIHSLKHLENEIHCVACQVHMTNESSLVSHTKSHRHAARLESFRASTSNENKNIGPLISSKSNVGDACRELKLMKQNLKRSPNISENETGLGNSLSKLTITEKKGEKSRKSTRNRSRNFMARPPKNQRSQRQNTRPKQSRPFDPKYLKANMEHIYEVNPEQLRILKLSCQLCFPKTSNFVYCFICENTVSSHLQTFYEHIWGKAHTAYLAEAELNDRYFMNYPEQFSDLTLAKEFMQESQEETIQCFACDETLKNEDTDIHEHIMKDYHTERKRLWNGAMEKKLQDILTEMKATWYNIQKYWCVFCDIEFNTEFQFAEHIDGEKHINCVKKMGAFKDRLIYDSCISCATLWLGLSGIHAQHCEQPMHKYLLGTGDFSVCKLPNQAKTLLENAVPEVDYLIELSDQVLNVEKIKADALLKCLEDTVKPLFPNVKAYPFGSRVSGLGFPDSDIDVFLDCGTYDGNKTTKGYQEQLIIAVEGCLNANQKSWEIEETLVSTRTPIIKLRHRDTELRCDVSFRNGLSVENTKLLKYFIDNYPLCRKLMLFLKKWLASCNLSGSHYITNYANCWYIIFYLQSKSILPSVATLIAKKDKSKLIDGWEIGISDQFHVDQQEFTFTELLHGFFEFYSKFDFRDSVVCPLLGRAIPKQDFTELDLLPKEMAPYVKHVATKSIDGSAELFRIDSEMCVQDPYDLSHNLTKAVRKFTLNRFRRLCATSAEVLNNFIQH